MEIKELKPKQGKIDIEVNVVSIEEPRIFNRFGKEGKVANAIVNDDSGEIKLTLWNEDVDKVKVGDKIKISNGYVNEFQGEMQLTAGRFGKLEIIGKGELKETEKKDKAIKEAEDEGMIADDIVEEEV